MSSGSDRRARQLPSWSRLHSDLEAFADLARSAAALPVRSTAELMRAATALDEARLAQAHALESLVRSASAVAAAWRVHGEASELLESLAARVDERSRSLEVLAAKLAQVTRQAQALLVPVANDALQAANARQVVVDNLAAATQLRDAIAAAELDDVLPDALAVVTELERLATRLPRPCSERTN